MRRRLGAGAQEATYAERWSAVVATVLLTTVLTGCVTRAPAAGPRVDPDVVLEQFSERVQAYVALRTRLAAGLPLLTPNSEPEAIAAHRYTLGSRIQAARPDADVGDLFTPDFRRVLQRLVDAVLDARARMLIVRGEREDLEEDRRAAITLRVNEPYPVDAGVGGVPPSLLKVLPRLPDDIEYRFVGRDLVLWDSETNLVVDYLKNVL